MLHISDLSVNKDLDQSAMASVRGGWKPSMPMFDATTRMTSKVADIDQVFQLGFAQGNAGDLTNNQSILGGNGTVAAQVDQLADQYNDMSVYDIGNTTVG